MGEAVDTIPSILNKPLFVSPDRRTDGRTLERKFLNGGYNIIPHTFKVAGYKNLVYAFCNFLSSNSLLRS